MSTANGNEPDRIDQVLAILAEMRTEMNHRFDAVDMRLDGVDTRLGNLECWAQDLDAQVKELQTAVTNLSQGVPV